MPLTHNMKDVCLIVLVGLPAAGKTTFCDLLKSNISPSEYSIKIYHFDDYLDNSKYHMSRSKIYELVRSDILLLQETSIPVLIILDDNMMYKSMRSQYYKLAMETEISFGMLYFPIDVHLAMMRNNNRQNKLPSEVISKIHKSLEVPTNAFIVDSNAGFNVLHKKFLNYVHNCLKNPLKELPRVHPLPVSNVSMKHKVDLILRSIVNEKIKERNWTELNIIKNNVYSNYKQGNIPIDSKWNDEKVKEILYKYFT